MSHDPPLCITFNYFALRRAELLGEVNVIKDNSEEKRARN